MQRTLLAAIAVVASASAYADGVGVDKARDALISGSYSTAIKLAEDGVSSASAAPVDKSEFQVILAEAHFEQGSLSSPGVPNDMAAALDGFAPLIDKSRSAKQICAAYGDVFSYRGLANDRLRHFNEALADMRNAVLCDPNDAFAQFGLGETNYGMEDFKEAVEAYSTAIKLRPDYKDALAHRAQNYENLHDLQSAVTDYNEVVRLAPNDNANYNNRGTALWKLGRNDEALADFTKSIEIDRQSFMAYLNRASLYYAKGEFGKARDDWNAGKTIFDSERQNLEKAVGAKTMAWFDYGFATTKEKLDDAPK